MADSGLVLLGVLALLAEGVLFGVLNELQTANGKDVQKFGQRLLRYWGELPTPESRKSHKQLAAGLIVTIVFALVPSGLQIMELHPCVAWGFYALAFICGAYSLWSITPISRWGRAVVLLAIASGWLFYGYRLLYSATELDFPFLNPGVFLIWGKGEWLLLVTGENTHRPLFNVQMVLQDDITLRSIGEEPDISKRATMIDASRTEKTYPEIGPDFMGDRIRFQPIDVNNQEYEMQARYRIGSQAFLINEEVRIVNVGPRYVSASQSTPTSPIWQFSVTARNQAGTVLMHCIDPRFPHDARWISGPACFPGARYGPLSRSLCTRCFGRGFEYRSEWAGVK